MHDYAVGDLVYGGITGIYRKLYYKKQLHYIITSVFKNYSVRVQRVQVNELINIRLFTPHFVE